MAYVAKCPRCGQEKVIDTHCGPHCFECMDKYPELTHKETCLTAIAKAKTNAGMILFWHECLRDAHLNLTKINKQIHTLKETLVNIDPCPECNGNNKYCPVCDGKKYAPLTTERRLELDQIANAPDPPKTC